MSNAVVMNDIETFFWSMVKQRQFSDRNYSLIDLEVDYHPSMEPYLEKVNELLRSCACEGFECFVKSVDPHEDKELWESGARSQLIIPHFLSNESLGLTKSAVVAVMGNIATSKGIFDNLRGINPFEYFLMDGDECVPVMREVRG
ncbi:hypothetical protein JJJ22_21140 (plasmid) [Aeromonas caviae]|uniref:Uncharacterized protein n=1 Tax=Aeromonas caviae TaxID=648 RepID=A0A6M4NQD0_AERCA|nr:hypothetical protein [Aeromonas caviae]QJR99753.1 Hypothetical protein [Aeromonas caviae]QQM77783.1 hypothetical protein JH254_20730 [Aeromonas caviae]QQV21664.1 hypothetical protein JJJ22_21140 [Aeromonas caviae]UJQ39249.1 hypothetical protein L1871_22415 [Aeromonas caviae]